MFCKLSSLHAMSLVPADGGTFLTCFSWARPSPTLCPLVSLTARCFMKYYCRFVGWLGKGRVLQQWTQKRWLIVHKCPRNVQRDAKVSIQTRGTERINVNRSHIVPHVDVWEHSSQRCAEQFWVGLFRPQKRRLLHIECHWTPLFFSWFAWEASRLWGWSLWVVKTPTFGSIGANLLLVCPGLVG